MSALADVARGGRSHSHVVCMATKSHKQCPRALRHVRCGCGHGSKGPNGCVNELFLVGRRCEH
eukprot:6525459-Prymnesium_polylepis.1